MSERLKFTLPKILVVSALIRLTLVVYSEYHDAHSALKYTDIDYHVFSDATRFLLNPTTEGEKAKGVLGNLAGLGDPYERATYRYTPLLAILLVPNEFLHPSFGKVLFSTCDLIIGILLYHLFQLSFPSTLQTDKSFWGKRPQHRALVYVSAGYLLNPMPINISTRGSAESVLGAMVISTLSLAMHGKWDACAIMLGLSVHFKIYPLIYAAGLLLAVGGEDLTLSTAKNYTQYLWVLLSRKRIRFASIALSSFMILNMVMYLTWGKPFIEHAYTYHLSRVDHRHNFSPYFYPLYLSSTLPATEGLGLLSNPLLSFVPQMILSIGSGVLLTASSILRANDPSVNKRSNQGPAVIAQDLPFIWFVQTLLFVAFNKVCTSQYFMWYLWFLPLVVPKLRLSAFNAAKLVIVWIGIQALWLSIAYRLEFLGEQVFLPLWASGVVFLAGNCFIAAQVMSLYSP